jgi:hypothetical protein
VEKERDFQNIHHSRHSPYFFFSEAFAAYIFTFNTKRFSSLSRTFAAMLVKEVL